MLTVTVTVELKSAPSIHTIVRTEKNTTQKVLQDPRLCVLII